MSFVCTQLAPADAEGKIACMQWVDDSSLLESFAITPEQGNVIAVKVALLFVVAWTAIIISRRIR
jgi:hypothetical protein